MTIYNDTLNRSDFTPCYDFITKLDLLPNYGMCYANRGRSLLQTSGPAHLRQEYVLIIETNDNLNHTLHELTLDSQDLTYRYYQFWTHYSIQVSIEHLQWVVYRLDTLSRPIWVLYNYAQLVDTKTFPQARRCFSGQNTSIISWYFVDFTFRLIKHGQSTVMLLLYIFVYRYTIYKRPYLKLGTLIFIWPLHFDFLLCICLWVGYLFYLSWLKCFLQREFWHKA